MIKKINFILACWHGMEKIAAPRGGLWERHMSQTCICACACECACVRVCAHVWWMRKHPFQDFCYLLNYTTLIYSSKHLIFRNVGLSFYFYMRRWRGVMWSVWSCDQIAIDDHHSSKGVCTTLLLGDDSFYNVSISAINLRSYSGWD